MKLEEVKLRLLRKNIVSSVLQRSSMIAWFTLCILVSENMTTNVRGAKSKLNT